MEEDISYVIFSMITEAYYLSCFATILWHFQKGKQVKTLLGHSRQKLTELTGWLLKWWVGSYSSTHARKHTHTLHPLCRQ